MKDDPRLRRADPALYFEGREERLDQGGGEGEAAGLENLAFPDVQMAVARPQNTDVAGFLCIYAAVDFVIDFTRKNGCYFIKIMAVFNLGILPVFHHGGAETEVAF